MVNFQGRVKFYKLVYLNIVVRKCYVLKKENIVNDVDFYFMNKIQLNNYNLCLNPLKVHIISYNRCCPKNCSFFFINTVHFVFKLMIIKVFS